ncbi:MAG TPA: hypothetical protein VNT56_02335 [Acidimicrobiales bacterium]|nr:hypothetical protein [Acidimicrobiales bacterium]
MVNTGARFWFGVTALGAIGAVAYLLASGAEKYGTLVLAFTAAAAALLGAASIILRDGNVALAAADAPGQEHAPPIVPRFPAAWPAVAALGAGVTIVGLAAGGGLLYVGLAILGVTFAEWMVQSWAERASTDADVNRRLRNRVMFPIEIPAAALLGIGVAVIAFSRILLAVSKTGSTVVAITVASVIFAVGIFLNARPRVSSSLVAGLAVVGAVGLLAGGVVSAVVGEREFEAHGEEHAEEGHAEEGGAHAGEAEGEGGTAGGEGEHGEEPGGEHSPAEAPAGAGG